MSMNVGFDDEHVATGFGLSFFKRKNNGNDSYSRKYLAFTMAEVLVTLLVLGILALILVTVLRGAQPDDIDAMHKKATAIIQRITNELSSDNYLYPRSVKSEGFTNTSAVTVDGITHQGDTKFCTLFVSRLVLKSGTEANCTAGALTATTAEGIEWYLPISDFQNGAQVLMIDANGPEEPNVVGEDRFEYYIQPGFTSEGYENTIVTSASELPPELARGADFSNLKAPDPRETLKTYKIEVKNKPAVGLQAVIGEGPNKVNGQYVLNAIPAPGYKCSWFTKHVTIKNSDVIVDDLICEPNLEIPGGKVADVQHPEPPEGYGTIRVTSEADYTYCPPDTPFDIIQTTILANGPGGSYSKEFTSNIGGSVDINEVLQGSYSLGYMNFDPTISAGCPSGIGTVDCYEPITNVTFSPSVVTVNPDEISDVTVTYGCAPETNNKSIKIKLEDLIARYPGTNTSNTTPEVKNVSGTLLVKTWQDVDITGIYVDTSDDDMRWVLVSDFDGGWGITPSSAVGDTPLKLTISNGHVSGGCFYAQSVDDKELKSNTVCFSRESDDKSEIKITCATPAPNTVHICNWQISGPSSEKGNLNAPKTEVIKAVKPGTYTITSPNGGSIKLLSGGVERIKNAEISEPSFVLKAGEKKHIIITLPYEGETGSISAKINYMDGYDGVASFEVNANGTDDFKTGTLTGGQGTSLTWTVKPDKYDIQVTPLSGCVGGVIDVAPTKVNVSADKTSYVTINVMGCEQE